MFEYAKKGEGGYSDEIYFGKIIAHVAILLSVIVAVNMAVMPTYNVWSEKKAGEAELAKAEYSKQVAVQTAKAKNESAQYEADAEVTRASGVAKANAIVAEGLGGPEGYLRYLYIHMLEASTDKQIIYIPTEAGLPILEAGKNK